MAITRCEMCMGKKTILGLGCLIKDCPGCKGIGHVKVVDEIKEHKDNVSFSSGDPEKSVRGRPKKARREVILDA